MSAVALVLHTWTQEVHNVCCLSLILFVQTWVNFIDSFTVILHKSRELHFLTLCTFSCQLSDLSVNAMVKSENIGHSNKDAAWFLLPTESYTVSLMLINWITNHFLSILDFTNYTDICRLSTKLVYSVSCKSNDCSVTFKEELGVSPPDSGIWLVNLTNMGSSI